MLRRNYLIGAVSTIAALLATNSSSKTQSKWMNLNSAKEGMWIDLETDGSVDAAQGEVSTNHVFEAFDLIWNIPKSDNPFEVANHLNNIQKNNSKGESYKEEWAIQFNPLIVFFFVIAKHEPEGDETPWCAAFVNFCIEHTGQKGTRSPGSRTFRNFGEEIDNPKEGDIVVFQEKDRPNRGHVGFYIDHGDDAVLVLGGNQGNKIKKTWYSKNGERLKLHSYRRLPVV